MKRFLTLTILLVVNSAFAAELYFGLAPHVYSVSSDNELIDNQTGTGLHLTMGYRWKYLGVEFTVGGATIDTGIEVDPFFPDNSADYGIFDVTAKYHQRFGKTDRFIPWIGVGTGVHIISWNDYVQSIDGSGYSVSGGCDVRLFSSCYLQGAVKYHWVSSDPHDFNTTEASLGLNWVFGRNT